MKPMQSKLDGFASVSQPPQLQTPLRTPEALVKQPHALALPLILEESPSQGQQSTITKRFAQLGVLSDQKAAKHQSSSSKEETKGEQHTGLTPLMGQVNISEVPPSNIEPSAI